MRLFLLRVLQTLDLLLSKSPPHNSFLACLSPPVSCQGCDLFTSATFLLSPLKNISTKLQVQARQVWWLLLLRQFINFSIPVQAHLTWYHLRVTLFLVFKSFNFLRLSRTIVELITKYLWLNPPGIELYTWSPSLFYNQPTK